MKTISFGRRSKRIERLLGELTPDILSYLFPGYEREGEPAVLSENRSAGRKKRRVGWLIGSIHYDCIQQDEKDVEAFEGRSEAPAFLPYHAPEADREVASEAVLFPEEAEESGEVSLDPRTRAILSEILRLQEKYKVSIEEIEMILGYTVRLSPLHISPTGKIFLSEYDCREVKMPNVAKALYFLYLRHPEGLRYKEVADHKDELLRIYGRISGRDDPEEMEKSIDLLVDPFGNALNVNASRIKAAFRNVVSDRIARFYYLNGAAGDVKKVPLDRDLVLWEH